MSESAQSSYGAPSDTNPGGQEDTKLPSAENTPGAQTPEMTVEYIAQLTEQLTQLASSINEDSLAYFLSMARAEAELVALRATHNK